MAEVDFPIVNVKPTVELYIKSSGRSLRGKSPLSPTNLGSGVDGVHPGAQWGMADYLLLKASKKVQTGGRRKHEPRHAQVRIYTDGIRARRVYQTRGLWNRYLGANEEMCPPDRIVNSFELNSSNRNNLGYSCRRDLSYKSTRLISLLLDLPRGGSYEP